jgi:hypothetical protein
MTKTAEQKFGRQDFLDDRYLWNNLGNYNDVQLGKKWQCWKRMNERRNEEASNKG